MNRQVIIANPIYDAVFKYLFDDIDVAKTILSTITGEEIVALRVNPRDRFAKNVPVDSEDNRLITIYYVDFSAEIRLKDGSIKVILIEIQKAKFAKDIVRFRKYLGMSYSDENYYYQDGDKTKPMPIVSIYFLGYRLKRMRAAMIKVERQCIDMLTGTVMEGTEEFIEAITHNSYIIQIPFLKEERQSEVEWLLTMFDQRYRWGRDVHQLAFGEREADEMEKRYPSIWRRLQRALGDEEVREQMFIEDYYIEELRSTQRKADSASKQFEQSVADRKRDVAQAVAEKEQAVADRKQAVADKEQAVADRKRDVAQAVAEKEQAVADRERDVAQAVAEKEQAVADRERAVAAAVAEEKEQAVADRERDVAAAVAEEKEQAEERMKQTIQRLMQRGFSVEEIAETTGLPPEQVEHWKE